MCWNNGSIGLLVLTYIHMFFPGIGLCHPVTPPFYIVDEPKGRRVDA